VMRRYPNFSEWEQIVVRSPIVNADLLAVYEDPWFGRVGNM
jgi:hypothetical protein